MSIWKLFERNKKQSSTQESGVTGSKEDIYKMIFSEMAREAPSRHFAAGTIFDVTRRYHDAFENSVRSNDVFKLHMLFAQAYQLYLSDPAALGEIPQLVDRTRNDTNPSMWNVDIVQMEHGDYAVLCFMPVQNDELIARVVGIAVSEQGDGYYYCMLNKDDAAESDVIRNNAMQGIERIGSVKGLGFELMQAFVECMKNDFYK